MVEILKEFNNYYNISKKGFTIPWVIQSMKLIAIIYTLSLFNPFKAIGTAFYNSAYDLDIGC